MRALTPSFLTILMLAGGCDQSPPVPAYTESKTLLHSSVAWDRTPYTRYPEGKPELALLIIQIPAHSTVEWHCYLPPSMGYVLSGQIQFENADGIRASLSAGGALAKISGGLHRARTTEKPAEILVFYASAQGIPLLTEAGECQEPMPGEHTTVR